MELLGFQRKYLRGLAHNLVPVVLIGRGGVSEAVIAAVDKALADHELIKVKMMEPEDKRAMAATLAERTDADLTGLIGHTVILYRPHPERPKIKLPPR